MRSNKFHQGFVGEINSEILVLSHVLLHGFNVPIYGYIWLVVDLPLWKLWVSWDHEIPNIWRKKMFQTTNQILYNISIPSDSQTWTIPQLLSYRWFWNTKPSVYEGFPSQTCGWSQKDIFPLHSHIFAIISQLYRSYIPIIVQLRFQFSIYLNYYPNNISIHPYHPRVNV